MWSEVVAIESQRGTGKTNGIVSRVIDDIENNYCDLCLIIVSYSIEIKRLQSLLNHLGYVNGFVICDARGIDKITRGLRAKSINVYIDEVWDIEERTQTYILETLAKSPIEYNIYAIGTHKEIGFLRFLK